MLVVVDGRMNEWCDTCAIISVILCVIVIESAATATFTIFSLIGIDGRSSSHPSSQAQLLDDAKREILSRYLSSFQLVVQPDISGERTRG